LPRIWPLPNRTFFYRGNALKTTHLRLEVEALLSGSGNADGVLTGILQNCEVTQVSPVTVHRD